MFKTRKKFVKYELVRQQELEFDVDFRVNSSESFNHEKFSISFQFDEFFRILNLKLTQNSQILSDFWSSCNFEAFEVEKLAKMFKTRPFRQFRQFRHFYTLILTWCPGMQYIIELFDGNFTWTSYLDIFTILCLKRREMAVLNFVRKTKKSIQ